MDLTEDKWVHAYAPLEKLPNKQFRNIEEVIKNLPET